MRRRGFTLVEALATIGLIGVLLALLAPALESARESARLAACGSNVRQLQLAAMLHARDHDDRYPPGAMDFHANLHRWHGTRERTGEAFDPARSPLAGYLDGGAASSIVRCCPSFAPVAEELTARGAGFEAGAGGYGYNNAFVGVVRAPDGRGGWLVLSDETGSRASRFASPSRTVGFTDAALLTDRLIEYSFAEPRVWPEHPEHAPDPSTHFRHAGAASVAWLDGRVSVERMSETAEGWFSEGSSGEAGLGWVGTASDNRLYDYE